MPTRLLLALTLSAWFSAAIRAKILIYPADCGFNSRLMNLVKMADILNANGHNATVLVNTKVARMLQPERTKLRTYHVPNVENLMLITDPEVIDRFKEFSVLGVNNLIDFWVNLTLPFCESTLGTHVLHDLKAEGYDLVIIDSIWHCGRILIDYLNVPSMSYSNWGFLMDPLTFYPALPSFVCNPGSTVCSSDTMTFSERLGNVLQSVFYSYYSTPKIIAIYDEMKNKFGLNVSRSIYDSISWRSPVIVNGDWVLDYPRPIMPHVLMIPGLFHRPPKPLPEDLLTFIEGSGQHGLVVVSFGSMVSKVDMDKAEIFAKVFGELSQRVLWRYTGEKPVALKNNTKLVSWFPQADVLGHPRVKLFITHCGISGTYEAAMNGLPVIAQPLFADQEYNARKLVERAGMGVRLDLDTMTETTLREAISKVLSNPRYAQNARQTALLLQDEEVPARQRLLYWVDYVIRHDGARHLVSETAFTMSNLVFYSMDVGLVLGAGVLALLAATAASVCCLVKAVRSCVSNNQKMKTL